MEIKVLDSHFLYSVPKLAIMRELGGEIAFIGRSNSGKSSLINAVCQKKDLARTSKLPGRTRHAVVYQMVMSDDTQQKNITLVDLPGFGFASMSKKEAQECEDLIFSYLEKRHSLKQIFLLLDIRRDPDEREKHIVKIAKNRGIDLFFILTKCDKVSLSARKPIVKKLVETLELDSDRVFLHSTHDEKYKHVLQTKIFESF
ncbi:MAG: ribosome biogenesis GTP-binding protein YsxC [Myxococcales bacterium]|nr:ribosome biogenesis GTP-binding protein YsxC [Myxococcales bacterium]USN50702.1 MAG: ribosome biogenesis GTP-binding protein YsxC [Myxococcales bacterium]